MNVMIGLCFGIGVFCIWAACTEESSAKSERIRPESKLAIALRQVGLEKISPKIFVLVSLFLGFIASVLVLALCGLYGLAALAFCAGTYLPRWYVLGTARKRAESMRELWPDVVDHLRSAVRAGLSLPEALMQLQYRGPEALRPVFESFSADYRASGDFVSSLNHLKERLSDPTSDNIVEALKVTREVGGTDLGRLLGTLSEFLRENARTRAEIKARQSWTVNAAKLAVVAPWGVLLLMGTQPGTIKVYNSFAGIIVMISGLVLSVVAYRLMLRLGALPQEKRVLA